MATGRPSLHRPPRGRGAAVLGAACLLGLFASACGDPLPGTPLGTFQVTAKAASNSCGLGAPSAYQFDVELSRQGNTLYWSWLDKQPISSGVLTPVSPGASQLKASLTATQSQNVDPTSAGAGPCTMTRTDDLVVTLAEGASPASFSGTMSYAFAAESGADCTDQLAASGGMYDALPCSVSYTIAATRQ